MPIDRLSAKSYVKPSGPSAMSDRRLPLIHVTQALGPSVYATSAHQDHKRAGKGLCILFRGYYISTKYRGKAILDLQNADRV